MKIEVSNLEIGIGWSQVVNTCGQRTPGLLQGRGQTTRWADDGALERRKATHLGRHCCLPLGWVVHWWLGYECRLSGGSSSHTQSSQIRKFREDAHLPVGCRRKLRHDERVSIRLLSRAWAENLGDIRRRPWNLQSVPANFCFDTVFNATLLHESFVDENRSDDWPLEL